MLAYHLIVNSVFVDIIHGVQSEAKILPQLIVTIINIIIVTDEY